MTDGGVDEDSGSVVDSMVDQRSGMVDTMDCHIGVCVHGVVGRRSCMVHGHVLAVDAVGGVGGEGGEARVRSWPAADQGQEEEGEGLEQGAG